MSECLVTTLKGVVEDDNLYPMGSFNVEITEGTGLTGFRVIATDNWTVIAHGGGNICETDGTVIGQKKTFSAGTVEVAFDEGVTSITVCAGYNALNTVGTSGKILNSERLMLLPLDSLKWQKGLDAIGVQGNRGGGITGDINTFIRTATNFGSFVAINNTRYPIKLSDFKGALKLRNIQLNNSVVTGTIEDLTDITSLRTAELVDGPIHISGDLAKLPPDMQLFYCYSGCSFTWSSRATTSWPIAFKYVNLGKYLDAMLINQAKCALESTASVKIMSLYGTRTSASDSAVTTLQNKGWTITVTEI